MVCEAIRKTDEQGVYNTDGYRQGKQRAIRVRSSRFVRKDSG